jgi:hypothetical protein
MAISQLNPEKGRMGCLASLVSFASCLLPAHASTGAGSPYFRSTTACFASKKNFLQHFSACSC